MAAEKGDLEAKQKLNFIQQIEGSIFDESIQKEEEMEAAKNWSNIILSEMEGQDSTNIEEDFSDVPF